MFSAHQPSNNIAITDIYFCFVYHYVYRISHHQSDESDAKVRNGLICFFIKLFIKHSNDYKVVIRLTVICSINSLHNTFYIYANELHCNANTTNRSADAELVPPPDARVDSWVVVIYSSHEGSWRYFSMSFKVFVWFVYFFVSFCLFILFTSFISLDVQNLKDQRYVTEWRQYLLDFLWMNIWISH